MTRTLFRAGHLAQVTGAELADGRRAVIKGPRVDRPRGRRAGAPGGGGGRQPATTAQTTLPLDFSGV
jgi:hypothetical protein